MKILFKIYVCKKYRISLFDSVSYIWFTNKSVKLNYIDRLGATDLIKIN